MYQQDGTKAFLDSSASFASDHGCNASTAWITTLSRLGPETRNVPVVSGQRAMNEEPETTQEREPKRSQKAPVMKTEPEADTNRPIVEANNAYIINYPPYRTEHLYGASSFRQSDTTAP